MSKELTMEFSRDNQLDTLDAEQKKAVTLETNGVVAAGAGSGKTKVLASRYAWLVTEKNLKPDEILSITFTNKAVGEMYSRIYLYLLESADSKARDAIKDFHRARISTLDSFSANVARTAAARYGISPDFVSGNAELKEIAREASLKFVLDHRESPAIRELLSDKKIRELSWKVFAYTVLNFSSISRPLKLGESLESQKEELIKAWREKTSLLEKIIDEIAEAVHTLAVKKKSIKLTEYLAESLRDPPPPRPDIAPLFETCLPVETNDEIRKGLKEYFDYYSALAAIPRHSSKDADYKIVDENFLLFKGKDDDGLYHELESIANSALNFGLCADIFGLIEKFQDEFNAKKREIGNLSFNDIAHLAVDALKDHPDIRKVYKDSLKMIMVDEFQDNNALQRDLVYLLAENPGRMEKGLAAPEELEKNRMFFVGDEKQSIYRFRGADVTVFRSLGLEGNIEIIHNYRSRPGLIAVFNYIFERIFLSPGHGVPDYEAAYSAVKASAKSEAEDTNPEDNNPRDCSPLAHFCFLNGGDLPKDDSSGLKAQDLEAAFIAGKIRDMVQKKEMIPKRTSEGIKWEECKWGDFAVLERYYTHQSKLEKSFREFGIPYNTDRPSGLFDDAPILDLRAYLRLLVYPEDRIAYAALIRSPFMRLSDLCLTACILGSAEPFAEENEPFIPKEELALYRRARERYRALREAKGSLSLTELITKLMFEEGYRFQTLWTESVQVYERLFDLFFSLVSDAEKRGKNLAEFVEYIDDVMAREEKPDDKDIPGEEEAGVRIITIHKSKGLEFPVVFIYDSANADNSGNSHDFVWYHEQYGLILKIPKAEELSFGGNYFREIMQEEEKAKDTAELRRLLYVAMTRAEYRLFLTFTLPRQNVTERKEWDMGGLEFNEEIIRRRLAQLDDKSLKTETFLTLLAGIISDCPSSLCSLETIPVLSRAEISSFAKHSDLSTGGAKGKPKVTQREAALAASPFYEKAEVLPEGRAGVPALQASALHYKLQTPAAITLKEDPLEKQDLSPADFGSLVHAVLEARLKGQSCTVPSKIRSRIDDEKALSKLIAHAELMADPFLTSELGQRWAASRRHESEFPVITSAIIEEKPVAILGKIDLLFEEEDEVVVADFKTDRVENPEDHYGQLAAYYRAAGDIFGKPVSAWLFYLRSGRAVNVTDAVKALSLEELVATQ